MESKNDSHRQQGKEKSSILFKERGRLLNLLYWEWFQKGRAHETYYVVVFIRILFPNEDKVCVFVLLIHLPSSATVLVPLFPFPRT
jgi:hypothetical protein